MQKTPSPIQNGKIVYQFSYDEILNRDIAPFLLQFDFHRHKSSILAQRTIGSLSLAFDLAACFEPETGLRHPSEVPEFRAFARHLVEQLPGLGILIDTSMDTGFPHLIFASLDEMQFHRVEKTVMFVEPAHFHAARERAVKSARALATELKISEEHQSIIATNLRAHLMQPIDSRM